MSEASRRTVQQQRIQQLQERLELYNAAATRNESDTNTSSLLGGGAASTATTAASRNAGKPTRAPPPVSSPNPTSQATPAAGVSESMFHSPLTASGAPSVGAAAAAGATATTTTTSAAAGATNANTAANAAVSGKAETSRISPQSQVHHQTPPAPPAPAPRLARNLAEDFVSSGASSPVKVSTDASRNASPFTTAAAAAAASSSTTATRAAPATAPYTSVNTAAKPPSSAAATSSTNTTTAGAPNAAAAAAAGPELPSVTSPLRASDVFGYYNASGEDEEHDEEGGNEYMEYEVEEVEEYEEEEEDEEDYSEEEEDGDAGHREDYREPNGGPPPTLDNVLRRIFRAYSGSPDRHAAASPPSAHRDPSLGSASATRVATDVNAASAAAAAGATHPLIQRAAELYRQHRLHQAQQLHHSPFHNASEGGSGGGHPSRRYTSGQHRDLSDESSLSTSDVSGDVHTDSDSELSTSTGSSGSYLSPAAAYAALGIGHAGTRAAGAGSAAAAAAAASGASLRTSASPSPPVTSSNSSAQPQQLPNLANAAAVAAAAAAAASSYPLDPAASSFDQLETAYRQLLLLQRGVEYAVERTGMQHFPEPLPHQEKAVALAQQRNALVQRDVELRAAPPGGPTLAEVRQNEATALEAAVAAIDAKFAAAVEAAKPVIARGAAVEEKRRLLQQREHDLAQQREARLIVEREVATMEEALAERRGRLKKREADYGAQLQQHDEQQKAAQAQISEVEQLSKQVSSWLAILEERDRRLARKEKRLQRVQTDLVRRNEDVVMWKKAAQRVKQIPPPPSPPRIIN